VNSREKILARVRTNQPKSDRHHIAESPHARSENPVEKFKQILISVGGAVLDLNGMDDIRRNITNLFPNASLIVSNLPELNSEYSETVVQDGPHALANVSVAILQGEFGVAENGAIWITDRTMVDRALPFICENLILLINKESILPTLHEAYTRIEEDEYTYGVFISGPSKTADIEQSLVLGAHGAKTLTVFIRH
jgi:L-lactate dehydrogenase complex protein LldG